MGASGLQILASTQDACVSRGCELCVTGAERRTVARPIRIVGLGRVLTMYPT